MEIRELLLPGSTYHVCTRSNGDELLFREHDDFVYFKESMQKRLQDIWEILSWNLLPNELHLVIRIKQMDQEKPISHAHAFGHVLNGYVQHYNRRYFRQGSLLNRSFRRKLIKTEDELRDIICMIDNLPKAKNLVSEKEEWKYGSYFEFLKSDFVTGAAQAVVEKFTDTIGYITHHLKSGLMKVNILPPRKWLSRWRKIDEDMLPTGDSPFG